MRLSEALDVGGDMHRPERPELAQSSLLAPAEKVRDGAQVRRPRVAVPNVGGEELKEALPT